MSFGNDGFLMLDDAHGFPAAKFVSSEENGAAQHSDDDEYEPHGERLKMKTVDAKENDGYQKTVVCAMDDHAPERVARAANCSGRNKVNGVGHQVQSCHAQHRNGVFAHLAVVQAR